MGAEMPAFSAMSEAHTPAGPRSPVRRGEARARILEPAPAAELHLLDGGHWALETNLGEIVTLSREFLGRVHA